MSLTLYTPGVTVPEQAFYFTGGIADVLSAAARS